MGDNSVPSTDDMKKHEKHSCTLLVLPSHIYLFVSGPLRMPLASLTCTSVVCCGAPLGARRYLKQNGNELSADKEKYYCMCSDTESQLTETSTMSPGTVVAKKLSRVIIGLHRASNC